MAEYFAPFYGCCGATVLYSFYHDPHKVIEWEMERVPDQRFGSRLVAKRDEKGNLIPSKTALEKFIERLKSGYADHGFLAVLTEEQLPTWMPIFKRLGFLFMCQWNNSNHGRRPNYLFVLPKKMSKIRGVPNNPLTPPKRWLELQEENTMGLRPPIPSPEASTKAA